MKQSLATVEELLYYLLILFIPTQLGKHFWPDFASVQGIRVDYLSPTIYLTDIIILLLFVVWISRKLKQKPAKSSKFKVQNSKIQLKIQKYSPLLIGVFVISYLLSVIVLSGRIMGGQYSLLKLFEMGFVSYYSAKFIINKNVFRKAVILLSIGGIFQAILAVAQFVNQGSIGGVLYFLGERSFASSTPGIANASLNGELVLRPYGTLPHPNVLAGYLLIVLILVLFTFKKLESAKVNALRASALVICSIALLLSMSRVAILLWIIIVVWILARNILRHSGLSRISLVKPSSDSGVASLPRMTRVISSIVTLGMIGFFILSPLGARFTNISTTDEAVVQRTTLIGSSFKMVEKSPLLGVGLGNYLPTLATIQQPLSTSTYLQPVHNIFLLVAAETGLIGLGIFLWFLWKIIKATNGKWQMANGISVCFFAILITGFFDHYWLTLQQGQLLFAFVVGLCLNNSPSNKMKQ